MSRIFLFALLCGCTANNSLNNSNSDLGDDGGGDDLAMSLNDLAQSSSMPDLAKNSSGPQDHAGTDCKGVSCGNMSCGSGMECCVRPGAGAMCVAPGGCPDGGA